MFVSIRRHQKWLWIVIGGATIVSFVWFFSPNSQYGGGGGSSYQKDRVVGTIYGRPVTVGEYLDAQREIFLSYFVSYNQWPEASQIPPSLVGNRILLTRKLEDLGIRADPGAVAQWISEAFRDPAQGGGFRQEQYKQFVSQFLPARGVSPAEFERFVQHEVSLRHLNTVMGLAGRLVTPQEAEESYRREHEKVDARIVFVARSNYLSKVKLEDAAITAHYSNNLALYRNPERVQISYVKFDAASFHAAAEQRMAKQSNEVEQVVSSYYAQRGPDYYKGTNGLALPAAEARQRIRDEEVRRSFAVVEAQKQANVLIEQLLELKPQTVEAFEKKAAEMGYQAVVTQPFGQFAQPAGANFPAGFGSAAFQLSTNAPYLEEAVVGTNAVFVAALKARIESSQKPFEEVRVQVTSDYQNREVLAMMNQAGRELQQGLKSAVAQGNAFDDAASGSGVQVVDLLPFAKQDVFVQGVPDQSSLSSVKDVIFALKRGEVSEFSPTQNGGFIAYLERRFAPTDDEVKQALPEYLKTLRTSSQSEAFRAWMDKERELAAISLPGIEGTANPQ